MKEIKPTELRSYSRALSDDEVHQLHITPYTGIILKPAVAVIDMDNPINRGLNGAPQLFNGQKYTYRVRWSEEDLEYIGTCDQFPSLSWLSAYKDGAADGIISLVAEVEADIAREQIANDPYSGIEKDNRNLSEVKPGMWVVDPKESDE